MPNPERRYRIGEVSRMLGVSIRTLRVWEVEFRQLAPRRDRVNRRYYLPEDIEIARRIKQLLKSEKFSLEGARIRLAQELHLEGRPRTKKELVDLIDSIDGDIRALLDRMDKTDENLRCNGERDGGPEDAPPRRPRLL